MRASNEQSASRRWILSRLQIDRDLCLREVDPENQPAGFFNWIFEKSDICVILETDHYQRRMTLLLLLRWSMIELLEGVFTADGQLLPAGTKVTLEEGYFPVILEGERHLIPVGTEIIPDGSSPDGRWQLLLSFSTQ